MVQPETSRIAENISENTARGIGALTLYFRTFEMRMQPLRPDYRRLPIYDGVDMARIFRVLGPGKYYQMDFTGQINPDFDMQLAAAVDEAIVERARQSDAYGVYITGEPDEDDNTKSSCVWLNRTAAWLALHVDNPAHDQGVEISRNGLYVGRPVLKHFDVVVDESFVPHYTEMAADWAA